MLELNSCSHADKKIADVAQCSVVNGDKNLTHRVVVGILTVNHEDNVYYFRSTKMIGGEKNLSTEGGDKDNLRGTRMIVDGKNLGTEDGGDKLCSTQLIVDEKSLDVGNNLCSTQKYRTHSRNEDYIVSDDDEREEESSKKKRQKNAEKRTMTFRKKTTQLQNYPPSELPQNL
ncbi:hypothetical protein ACET3Z_001224 [Daucus carota]